MLGKLYDRQQDCAIAGALEVIGERWTLLIVRDAMFGVRRFSDFQAHLDIPKAVLSERLNSLVGNGVLDRAPDPDHAGRQLYVLTEAGRELWPVIHAIVTWGGRHRRSNSRRFRHVVCGSELAADGSCRKCKLVPDVGDVITEPKPRRGGLRDDPVALALRKPHRMLQPLEVG
jgi:DNA-binding HxlR family transcriptional regulator